MNALKDIFAEYINKRTKGFETQETLNMLKPYIVALPKIEKRELSTLIRKWEHKNHLRNAPMFADIDKSGTVEMVQTDDLNRTTTFPIVSANNTSTDELDAIRAEAARRRALKEKDKKARQTQTVRVLKSFNPFNKKSDTDPLYVEAKRACPKCGYENKVDHVICYACGEMLGIIGTRHLEADQTDFAFHHFGTDTILVLKLRDIGYEFELLPQSAGKDLVMGRSVEGSPVKPDIDLADYGGDQFGISRLHLAFRYEAKENAMHVYDMGSSNGSFLNGQRLHPREVRLLRNGDELRLSRMIIRVLYRHPSD